MTDNQNEIKNKFELIMNERGILSSTKGKYRSYLTLLSRYYPGLITQDTLREFLNTGKRVGHTRNNSLGRAFVRLYCKASNITYEMEAKRKRKNSIERNAYPDEYFDLLIKTAEEAGDPESSLLLRLGRRTGCRKAELLHISKNSINVETGEIRVLGKGQKYRTVVVTGDLLQELIKKTEDKEVNKPIFTSYKYPQELNFRLYKYMKIANIPKSCPHAICRHTFATKMRQKGISIELLQKALGHASINETMIYAHVENKELIELWKKANQGEE